jgi:putative membrane protein
MNKIATLLLAFALPCFAQTAPNQGAVPGSQSPANKKQAAGTDRNTDAQFATSVAQANMAEVALGKLAQEKSQRDDIKKFAQKMVDEHTKAQQDLEGIASKNNLTLPKDLSAQQKTQLDRLSKLSGPEFDRAYARLMVMDHTRVSNALQHESQKVSANADLKDYATRMYPGVSDHLTIAKTIVSEIDQRGKAGNTGSQAKK